MSTAVVLQSLELLSLLASVLKVNSGDSEAVDKIADVVKFAVGAAKAGSEAAQSLGDLRSQLVAFNVEGRGPTDEEHATWRARSGEASDRIQAAAADGTDEAT